ncbi:hypothetical protein B0H16DRAFT_1715276 [Mycena metata]|uniref:Uncharacterized protein n=1 Tax=Mycena metata TaxID=1033252 RepID=A0AAD7NPU0_9AGAR|nr:hypothetical protein B0H16DRAFT_1715276 [Mycena metata]
MSPADAQRIGNQLDQLAARMEYMSTQPDTPSRQSSHSAPLSASSSSSMTGVSSFVEEPASMLSPLVLPASAHKHSNRGLGRHSSVPVPPLPKPPPPSLPANLPATSPAAPGPTLTPPRTNPLPTPPQELGRHPGITLPVQRTPPPSYRVAVRKGLWNRRGDHLTVDGFVVYAPVDRAYPDELRDYPAEAVGYRDHHGAEVGYLDRPELPESLPRFGQPPRQPYEKFVVYEYMQ